MASFELRNRIEVAKVGTWNDFPITEEILKEAALNTKGRVPIRPGHVEIKAGDKAYGYLENPKFEKNGLWFDQILYDETAKDWQDGYYINRSMDLSKRNNKYMVSAMALLGAEAPGIKGLETFKDEDIETLRFTQKINNEVVMPEIKTFSDGYTEGRTAREAELKLEFADEKKAALTNQEKELTLKFDEKLKEKDSKIEELEKKVEETEKKRFSDKIAEVKAKFPEEKQEAIETELKEFSEKMDFETFAKVADMKQPETIEFSESKKVEFSEKIIDEYNSPAR